MDDAKSRKLKPRAEGFVDKRRCRHCGIIGHIWRNCGARAEEEKLKKNAEVLIAEDEEDYEDEKEAYSHSFESTVMMIEDEDRVFFTDSEVILDSAAGRSEFRNRQLTRAALTSNSVG